MTRSTWGVKDVKLQRNFLLTNLPSEREAQRDAEVRIDHLHVQGQVRGRQGGARHRIVDGGGSYYVFKGAGYDVKIASINGGEVSALWKQQRLFCLMV